MYPEGRGYGATLRSTWDGVHKSSATTDNEIPFNRIRKGRLCKSGFSKKTKLK